MLMFAGCQNRESWLQEICAIESGFEYSTGPMKTHRRIPTDTVMLDDSLDLVATRGPVLTWMADSGFQVVEIRHKKTEHPVTTPVTTVDRYSIAEPAVDCFADARIDEKAIASLDLGENRCIRLERNVAPLARYLFSYQVTREPRTLQDRVLGQEAIRTRYVLLDRMNGRVIASIEGAAFSGTRGMFSPRGNSCDRSHEKEMMKALLQSPSDRRNWFEVLQLDQR